MTIMDGVYLFIMAVAGFFIYTRLRPGAVDPRIFRSRHDRMFGGFFGGLGARLGVAPLWFRLAWCVAFFLLEPVRFQLLASYVLLWAIAPREPPRVATTTIDGQIVDGHVTVQPYTSSYGTPAWRIRRRFDKPNLPY